MTALLSVFVEATARSSVADFVEALVRVYGILIVAYILTQIFFNFGGRMPYSRVADGVFGFLRDICEPYLGIFRRYIPAIGPFDLSPIIGLILLQVIGQVVVNVIRG
jgi:YggT family protein